MTTRTVTVVKPTPDTRLGVRLADVKGKHGGVKVTELDPSSLMVGLIGKGEIIMSINGIPCTDGHVAAATALTLRPASRRRRGEVGLCFH